MNRKLGGWFSVFISLTAASALCQEGISQNDLINSFFQRGKYEGGLVSGVMFSPIGADKGRHTVDYTLSGLQLGWMLTDANESALLPGNWELLGEAMGGAVFAGRGNYIVGGTVWARYNFLVPNWRLVPYAQAGGGAEGTDMDQRLIGQKFNFNLDVATGVRCFVAKSLSIDLEFRYQHISNAKLSGTDIGINSVGPMIGLSYFF